MAVLGLRASLGIGRGDDLDAFIFKAVNEALGVELEEFEREWRPAVEEDRTKRERVGDTAAGLVQEWYASRDPSWLYSHPKVFWDLLSNSVYQTSQTVANGLRLMQKEYLEPEGDILDFGAGPGLSTVILSANLPDHGVRYCELNREMQQLMVWFARRAGRTQRIRFTYLESLPYDNVELGMVVALESVEVFRSPHHDRPVGVLGPWWDMVQYLKSGGLVMEHTSWSAERSGYPTLSYYPTYIIDGSEYPAHQCRAPFRRAMVDRRFTMVAEGWNSSPTIWIKE